MRLHLISASCLRVWELSCHELKENNSIGIDIRLETVRVVILHPDNLRSLWNPKQIMEKHFFFSIWHLSKNVIRVAMVKTQLLLTIQRMDPEGCST